MSFVAWEWLGCNTGKRMFRFRNERINELMKREFGASVSERALQTWPISLVAPNRSTIWRWLRGQSAIPIDQIAPFAAALNVDPVVFFDTTPEDYERICVSLMQDVASSERSFLSRQLEWAYELITPSSQWPPKTLARRFYDRNWFTFDFAHDAKKKRNFFQRLMLSSSKEPQVWHFAFRGSGAMQSVWRPYGILQRDSGVLRLYHCRGSLFELAGRNK